MDINNNKPKFINTYVPTLNLRQQNLQEAEEFQEYYEQDRLRQQEESIKQMVSIKKREDYIREKLEQDKNQYNSNVTKKERKRTITIDTRDIDKNLYPSPNHFKVPLGKTFDNVHSIELLKIEFPNTSAVINSTNNYIYWRNQEDIILNIIDPITNTYPIYSVALRIGSYDYNTLQSEIISKLNLVKRKNKTGDFHNFQVSLDLQTDIVSLTSLTLQYLDNNAMTSITGSGVISIVAESHGFLTGDIVYISGTNTFAGLPASTLNSQYSVIVIDSNTFTIEANVKATDTISGGGNLIKIGKKAPYQLLFGEFSNTLAPNIGFPLEDSSQRIDTTIGSVQNLQNIILITTSAPHNLSNNNNSLGKHIDIINSGTSSPDISTINRTYPTVNTFLDTPILDGFYNEIVYIPTNTSIGIVVYDFNNSSSNASFTLPSQIGANSSELILPSSASSVNNIYSGWFVKVTSGSNTAVIRKIVNYNSTTNVATLGDSWDNTNPILGDTILLYDPNNLNTTTKTPTLNQVRLAFGSIFVTGGLQGIAILNNIEHLVSSIENYQFNYLRVKTLSNHNYDPLVDTGKVVTLYNTDSVPSLDGDQLIISIPSSTTFLLRGKLLLAGDATRGNIPRNNPLNTTIKYIQAAIPGSFTLFQCNSHGLRIGDVVNIYNVKSVPSMEITRYSIVAIPDSNHFSINFQTTSVNITEESYIGFGLISVSYPNHGFNNIIYIANGDPGEVIIQTVVPHLLNTNDNIQISQTNCSPTINGFYSVNVISEDTFAILTYRPIPASSVLGSQMDATSTTVILPSSVGSTNYTGYFIKMTSGNSTGVYKYISSYNSSTFTATIDSTWAIQPSITDSFILYEIPTAFSGNLPVQTGIASNELLLPNLSPSNEALISNGDFVKITTGSNASVIKKVIGSSSVSSGPVTLTLDSSFTSSFVGGEAFLYYNAPININGDSGILGMTNDFYLYGCLDIGGITNDFLNNSLHTVRDVIDFNTFTFMIPSAFSSFNEKGGGSNIFISSLRHGFDGLQENTKNDVLNRSINLEGENYIFITSPQLELDTIQNTGYAVENIFARVTLDTAPGSIVFSSFSNTISQPKIYSEGALAKLTELEFFVRNPDNTLYNFNNLDWSMALDITEIIQSDPNFLISSRTS